MNRKRFFATFISIFLGIYVLCLAGVGAQSVSSDGVTLSDAQWVSAQARFNHDIYTLVNWLKDYETRRKNLKSKIEHLQNKTAELRAKTRADENVFNEMRLKEQLNELEGKLEENSKAEQEAGIKQKDFEQKCLSLIDLYNDRIETSLRDGDVNESPAMLDAKVNQLSELARKRNQIQNLLKQYRKEDAVEKPEMMSGVATLKTNDQETLLMTLDLFKDRQKTLEEQVEKWSLELDGLRNELKLQGEMRDFLKDIQNMNTDSNFAQGNLKPEDLEFLSMDSHKKKLANRLDEVQQDILQGRKLLVQVDLLLTKVQSRLDSLNGRKNP